MKTLVAIVIGVVVLLSGCTSALQCQNMCGDAGVHRYDDALGVCECK